MGGKSLPNVGIAPRICWLGFLLFGVQKWRSKSKLWHWEARFNEANEVPSEIERSWVSLMCDWLDSKAGSKFRLRIGNERSLFRLLTGSHEYDPKPITLLMLCDPISLSRPSHCMRGRGSLWLNHFMSRWSCVSLFGTEYMPGSAQPTKD